MIPTVAVAIFAFSGCGSGGSFANRPRPASPVNVSVYINNSRVSVSPASVGAGQVMFVVTNQANRAVSLTIRSPRGSRPLATTGPINRQGTGQVAVDLRRGDYSLSTGRTGATDAALAGPSAIAPAALHIGTRRPTSSNQLLLP